MPIFDYQCEACGHHFDILQKAGEGALRKCPECGKLKLRKLLSAPSFHLKGGGWYSDGYDRKAGASTPATSGDVAPASSAPAPSSTETAAAPTPPAKKSKKTKSTGTSGKA